MFHARGAAAADNQRRIVTRARLVEYALGHVVEVQPDFSLDMGRFDASFYQKLAGFVEEPFHPRLLVRRPLADDSLPVRFLVRGENVAVVPQGRRQLRQT